MLMQNARNGETLSHIPETRAVKYGEKGYQA